MLKMPRHGGRPAVGNAQFSHAKMGMMGNNRTNASLCTEHRQVFCGALFAPTVMKQGIVSLSKNHPVLWQIQTAYFFYFFAFLTLEFSIDAAYSARLALAAPSLNINTKQFVLARRVPCGGPYQVAPCDNRVVSVNLFDCSVVQGPAAPHIDVDAADVDESRSFLLACRALSQARRPVFCSRGGAVEGQNKRFD